MLDALSAYPRVIFHHWKAVLIGSASSVGVLTGFSLSDAMHWPLSRWGVVLGAGLLVAQFQAWREEREKSDGLSRRLEKLQDAEAKAAEAKALTKGQVAELASHAKEIGIRMAVIRDTAQGQIPEYPEPQQPPDGFEGLDEIFKLRAEEERKEPPSWFAESTKAVEDARKFLGTLGPEYVARFDSYSDNELVPEPKFPSGTKAMIDSWKALSIRKSILLRFIEELTPR